jgi:hypothetical protein
LKNKQREKEMSKNMFKFPDTKPKPLKELKTVVPSATNQI